MTTPTEDPGWGTVGQFLAALAVPSSAMRNRSGGVAGMRGLQLGTLTVLPLITVVGVWLASELSEGQTGDLSIGLGAVGLMAVVAIGGRVLIGRRAFDCTDAQALAVAFRSRVFLEIALANAVGLVGFVATIVVGSPWPVLLGMAVAITARVTDLLTRRRLEVEQRRLTEAGCALDFVAALELPGPGRRKHG